MLAQQGTKILPNFDTSTLKDTTSTNNMETPKITQEVPKIDKTKDTTNPLDLLTQQIQVLQQQLSDIQTRASSKHYSLEDISPYPFDKGLIMIPFPSNFEVPKFDKYWGKGDPRDHIREFSAACLEVTHNETYLMQLFSRSLGKQAMEWFSHLPPDIQNFNELVDKFITRFSYNIEHEISMLDLCNTKQKGEESFASFLQRWSQLAIKCPYHMLEK